MGILAGVVTVVLFVTNRGPSYPDEWDSRVASIAHWVESTRGLGYKTPVYVDFLPDAEFKARVQQPTANPTDDDRRQQRKSTQHSQRSPRGDKELEHQEDDAEQEQQECPGCGVHGCCLGRAANRGDVE